MKRSELRQMIKEEVQKINEDNKVKLKMICINAGRVATMNSDARSAEIRKGDVIQIYRENHYNYFGSPILQSGMRFKLDPGLSGKKIKDKFPNTSGLEIAIQKDKLTNVEDDFWATFKKK